MKTVNYKKILWWLIALVLLYVLFIRVDIQQSWIILQGLAWHWIFIIFLLIFFRRILKTYCWQILLKYIDHKVSFWALLKITTLGEVYSNLLFHGSAGELAKTLHLTRAEKIDFSDSLATTLVPKITGFVSLLFFLFLGALLNYNLIFARGLWRFAVIVLVIVSIVIIVFFSKKFRRLVLARIKLKKYKWIDFVKKCYLAVHSYRARTAALVFSTVLSLMIQGCNLIINYMIFIGLGATISFSQILLVIPLIGLGNIIPVSIGNLGWREGIYIYLFNIFLIPASLTLVAALLLRVFSIGFNFLLLGIIYLHQFFKKIIQTAARKI